MKESADENREFHNTLSSGEKGQEVSKHQRTSGYVKDNIFESILSSLLPLSDTL